MIMNTSATQALHSLVILKKANCEELQQDVNDFFNQFGHNEEEVFEMFDELADDILNGNFPENQQVRLYDYDSFLQEYVEEDIACRGRDYKEGWETVFHSLGSDEQRKFIFHYYIKHSNCFDANNVREWQNQIYNDSKKVYYDRCLFYILEKL
jgi:hypothetical protein